MVAIGMLTQRETPKSSPTPATPANSVSNAPIDEANKVNAETHAQPRPKRSRISAPCPRLVTMPSRTVISWTT